MSPVVGRQLITIAYDSTTVSVTNNYFDGVSTYTTGCDGYHYWGFIIGGPKLRVTFAQNYVYHTSGRGPSVAGSTTDDTLLHAVNNLWEDIKGHAFSIGPGAQVLMEGNQFTGVTTVDTQSGDGAVYYVHTVDQAGTPCTSTLGRICEWNKYTNSGNVPLTRQNTDVLNTLKSYSTVKSYQPYSAYDTTTKVKANAGTGKV